MKYVLVISPARTLQLINFLDLVFEKLYFRNFVNNRMVILR